VRSRFKDTRARFLKKYELIIFFKKYLAILSLYLLNRSSLTVRFSKHVMTVAGCKKKLKNIVRSRFKDTRARFLKSDDSPSSLVQKREYVVGVGADVRVVVLNSGASTFILRNYE
jgi:hypothetical protein